MTILKINRRERLYELAVQAHELTEKIEMELARLNYLITTKSPDWQKAYPGRVYTEMAINLKSIREAVQTLGIIYEICDQEEGVTFE
jgi:hypothetical protein